MNTVVDSPQLDTILDTLANKTRRELIHDLSFHPATVGQLARQHNFSLPAIHKHIRSLEKANLIIRKKVGRTNFIALDQSSLKIVQDWVMQYQTEWGNVNASLENYISRMQE